MRSRLSTASSSSSYGPTQLLGISTGHTGQLLVTAGQNIDRLRGESAFAALCGASPIPASSGKTAAATPDRDDHVRQPRFRNHPQTHLTSIGTSQGDRRAGVRQRELQPADRSLPTPRQVSLPPRMAADHRHPQPSESSTVISAPLTASWGRLARRRGYAHAVRLFRRGGSPDKDPPVAIDDSRFEGWETVSTFEDQSTAVASCSGAPASFAVLWNCRYLRLFWPTCI